MRIGLVVDSACDLPGDYLRRNGITILPITVRIGDAVLADHRDEAGDPASSCTRTSPNAAPKRRPCRSPSSRSSDLFLRSW